MSEESTNAPVSLCDKRKNDVCSYYESDDYDPQSSWIHSTDKAQNIISLCNKFPHTNILEIGCGDGAVLVRLHEKEFAKNLRGVDICKTAIDKAKNRAESRNIKSGLEFEVFDFDADKREQFPYKGIEFNLCILTHVIEHVENPRRLLCEAGNVAPYVFVEVPLEDTLRLKKASYYDDDYDEYDDYEPDDEFDEHINIYSYNSIRWLIQSCGFIIISHKVTIPSFKVYKLRFGEQRADLEYKPAKLALQMNDRVAASFFDCYISSILCKQEPELCNCKPKSVN